MDPDFLKRLTEAFIEEAQEQLQIIRASLIALEGNPEDRSQRLESLLRTFHSLKGSSRAVNLAAVERSCQVIENALIKYKDNQSTIPRSLLDGLHEYVDSLHKVVSKLEARESHEDYAELAEIANRLIKEESAPNAPITGLASGEYDALMSGQQARISHDLLDETTASGTHRPLSIGPIGSTVRLKVSRVEDMVRNAEELVYAKLISDQRYIDCGELQSIVNLWLRRWQRLRPEVENEVQRKLSGAHNGAGTVFSSLNATSLQEFLDQHDSFVGRLQERLNTLEKQVLFDRRTVETMVDTLLERSRELTMIPFAVLQELFVKIVRDLSRDQGKSISLKISGGAIEIDRHILDELREPLIHLLRNCIDHGIETPEERQRSGKPGEAIIDIHLYLQGAGKVEIVLRDDGRGIDPERIKSLAIEKGILPREKAVSLSQHDALALIFKSSLSTRGTVSEISGRGLGCAIVKERLEELGGECEVYSKLGRETTFRLIVPIRRATMVGIAAMVGARTFIMPTAAIKAALRARDQDVRVVEGRRTMTFKERLVPIVSLASILSLETSVSVDDSTILVVGSDEYPIALLVDDVLGEQEVAVKSLPLPLTRVRNIGGATLLKTGDLALVLNINDLLTSAVLHGSMEIQSQPTGPRSQSRSHKTLQKRILVVEDSITSRVLLKNILESAGYVVHVANDGQDAWEKLAGERYDLVVTDVEMPRMNGFELTTKIRKESNARDVPIIVVTSLASLEDRRKGVEVGANAYFVKSNFEKSNLLEMVKRMI